MKVAHMLDNVQLPTNVIYMIKQILIVLVYISETKHSLQALFRYLAFMTLVNKIISMWMSYMHSPMVRNGPPQQFELHIVDPLGLPSQLVNVRQPTNTGELFNTLGLKLGASVERKVIMIYLIWNLSQT